MTMLQMTVYKIVQEHGVEQHPLMSVVLVYRMELTMQMHVPKIVLENGVVL